MANTAMSPATTPPAIYERMPRSSMPSATKLSGEALVTTPPVAMLHTMEQNAN